MLNNYQVIIDTDGKQKIVGQEKSDQCHKLSELGKRAGKVTSDTEKDHTPVYQTVHQKKA